MKLKSLLSTTLDMLKEKGISTDRLRKATDPSELLTQLITALANLSGDYKGNYSPASSYDDLLRQFNALQNLNVSYGKQLAFYREKQKQKDHCVAENKLQQEELNAERAANERLTIDNERLRGNQLEKDAETERLKVLVISLGGDPERTDEVG